MKRVLIVIPREKDLDPDDVRENIMIFLGTRCAEMLEFPGMIGIKENVELTEDDLDFIETACEKGGCSFILLQDKEDGEAIRSYGTGEGVVCNIVNRNSLWKKSSSRR